MVNDVAEVIDENLLEYMHVGVKVVLNSNVQRLTYAGKTVEDLKPGSVVNLWRWVADVLVSAGYAEYASKPSTSSQLMQVEWREKNNPSDLQALPRHFYLDWLREAEKGDKEVARRLTDIMTMRLMKIVALAAKRLDGEIVKKLTPEEEALYRSVFKMVDEWVSRMFSKRGD
ncbi:MAG: DNA replication complex GINS family protein [Candidatus Caldarchaeum sp.]|nr:DNA replication complex GINS family protein [Candidatus Caldarchaeum sp.]MDW7977186.1 hypothetical protein [Candidatus Caldarchaeum sp.]MDW8360700.1 hypothetical protein [Candidatus Caldarchaeum sp.]